MQKSSFSSTMLTFRGIAGILFGVVTCLVITMYLRPNLALPLLFIGVAARIAGVSHPKHFALFAAILGILPGIFQGMNYLLASELHQVPIHEYIFPAIISGIIYAGFYALLGFFLAKILIFLKDFLRRRTIFL